MSDALEVLTKIALHREFGLTDKEVDDMDDYAIRLRLFMIDTLAKKQELIR